MSIRAFLDLLEELPVIPICCYCKVGIRINEHWIYLEPDEAQCLVESEKLSHTICPKCWPKAQKELDELRKIKSKQSKYDLLMNSQ